MTLKVELKEFDNRETCKQFINEFIQDKKLKQNTVSTVLKKDTIVYVVYIEYEE